MYVWLTYIYACSTRLPPLTPGHPLKGPRTPWDWTPAAGMKDRLQAGDAARLRTSSRWQGPRPAHGGIHWSAYIHIYIDLLCTCISQKKTVVADQCSGCICTQVVYIYIFTNTDMSVYMSMYMYTYIYIYVHSFCMYTRAYLHVGRRAPRFRLRGIGVEERLPFALCG